MFSRFFIERPVLSNTLALVIVLVGALCLLRLPASQYPDVVPPTVQVTATYPGASARTVMETVALPIETKVNGVEGMLYMKSVSGSDGSYTLTVTFAIGTNPDTAQILVQNRVSLAEAQLPAAVTAQGLSVKKKSTSILQFVNLYAEDGRYDSLFLSNYATISLKNELSRITGVGDVTVLGAGSYAMRVWLDPERLQTYGLTPSDVSTAISQQSTQVASGLVGGPPAPDSASFQYVLNVPGRFSDAADFENIIIKTAAGQAGRMVRVRDVARVELGASTYGVAATLDGKPSAAIAISQLSGANALAVAESVNARMAELAKSFPAGLAYTVSFDSTKFVTASIHEVYETLIIAALLVLAVILIFLQDWRAMLIPATTVPVTIVGAFAAMAAMGYTVNTTSMFALVLAIGVVVDDAIVIVEGVARHMEDGLAPREAAVKAMNELTGPVIGITLVLMSVFLPAAMMDGLTGKMYQQFALVIAATALISAINAVTLKPTQCALWLRPQTPPAQRNVVYRAFNAVYGRCEAVYVAIERRLVRHAVASALVGVALIGAAFWGLAQTPSGFLPGEDQGYFIVNVRLPDSASAQRTAKVVDAAVTRLRALDGVAHVIGVAGISPVDGNATLYNAGMLYMVLKPWDERTTAALKLASIAARAQSSLNEMDTAVAQVLTPPPIQGVGDASGFSMMVEMRDGSVDFTALQEAADTLAANANAQSRLSQVNATFQGAVKQLRLEVDRDKAERLGVSVNAVFKALEGYVGSSYVNQFTKYNTVFQVYVQADAAYRLEPKHILALKVKTGDGVMTPLGAVAQIVDDLGPPLITLYNLYPAASVMGSPASGVSSGAAMTLMDNVARASLPPTMGAEWTDMSYQEQVVGDQIYWIFGIALLLVYFVLAAQYENWVQPLAVILTVPMALVGVVATLTALGMSNDLYTQIGVVSLIALAAKNAILIVEYAREMQQHGMDAPTAAVEAARLRFRPILMTSFAFILGMVPLATATGAGSGARVSLGVAVVSGMLSATVLAVLLTPVFYAVLEQLRAAFGRRGRKQAASASS